MFSPQKTFNHKEGKQQRSNIEKGISDMLNNPADEFNANNAYLMEFAICWEDWRQLRFYGFEGSKNIPDFFNQLWDLCDVMVDLLSAKVKPEKVREIDDELKRIKNNIDNCFIKHISGNMWIDTKKASEVLDEIKTQFRIILAQIQIAGMLTKVHADPKLAMSETE